jgi:hypothetical protein
MVDNNRGNGRQTRWAMAAGAKNHPERSNPVSHTAAIFETGVRGLDIRRVGIALEESLIKRLSDYRRTDGSFNG